MMKTHNVLLACALSAGAYFGAGSPASAARVSVRTARPAATVRVVRPGNRHYVTRYRYGYRYGYRNPYAYGYGYPYGYGVGGGYGYGYPYGYGVGVGYGYVGGGYGYAPYPAVYGRRAYFVRRPYLRPYRRAYWGRRFVR